MSNVLNKHPLYHLFVDQTARRFTYVGTLALAVAHRMEHAAGLRAHVEDTTRVHWGRGASKVLTFEERDRPRERVRELVLSGYVYSDEDLQELLKSAFKLGQQNPNR